MVNESNKLKDYKDRQYFVKKSEKRRKQKQLAKYRQYLSNYDK